MQFASDLSWFAIFLFGQGKFLILKNVILISKQVNTAKVTSLV